MIVISSNLARLTFCGAMFFALVQCVDGKPVDSGSARVDHWAKTRPQGVGYLRVGTQMGAWFDLEYGNLTVQTNDAILAGKPDPSADLGAPLTNCDTDSLYCFSSGFRIVVPKTDPFPPEWQAFPPDWKGAAITCRTLPRAQDLPPDATSAVCRFGKDRATFFDFTPRRGVMRYRSECPGCGGEMLELVGAVGLFARGE